MLTYAACDSSKTPSAAGRRLVVVAIAVGALVGSLLATAAPASADGKRVTIEMEHVSLLSDENAEPIHVGPATKTVNLQLPPEVDRFDFRDTDWSIVAWSDDGDDLEVDLPQGTMTLTSNTVIPCDFSTLAPEATQANLALDIGRWPQDDRTRFSKNDDRVVRLDLDLVWDPQAPATVTVRRLTFGKDLTLSLSNGGSKSKPIEVRRGSALTISTGVPVFKTPPWGPPFGTSVRMKLTAQYAWKSTYKGRSLPTGGDYREDLILVPVPLKPSADGKSVTIAFPRSLQLPTNAKDRKNEQLFVQWERLRRDEPGSMVIVLRVALH